MKKSALSYYLFCLVLTLNAQSWRSTYYPIDWTPPTQKNFYTDAFLQDYSYAGYKRGEEAIPLPSGTVYDVTKSPYNADKTGVADATTAIQNAINDAQTNNGGVVYLPAGTYKLNPGSNAHALRISKSNIYLKGDGVGQTFLLNNSYTMNNKSVIKFSGSASWTTIPTSKALLTADIMNPVNVLPIDNPSLFAVGDLVLVRNVIGDDWITEHKETEWLGYGSSLRGLMYCRYITAIDNVNKTITVDIPVRYALKTRDGACVFKLSGMISEVGLMDFSIGNVQNPSTTGFEEEDYTTSGTAAYNSHASYLINFNAVLNGWMKNVSTYKPASNTTGAHMLSNGFVIQYSKNVTVDNCSMSYAQYGGGGGNGYSYLVRANEVLIKNSTSNFVRHGFVFSSMWSSGNVFHKCNDIKTGYQCGSTGSETTNGYGSDHHMHFSQSNLIDNTYVENSAFYAYYRPYGSTPKHNITATHTAYWNIRSGGTKPLCVWTQQSRYGYAIGTSGTATAVYTKENSTGTATITDPVDITEGIGQGTTLTPQSLYLDQLNKRIQLINSCNEVIASGDDGNVASNVLDGNLATRWSADGDGQYLEFCFTNQKLIEGINIAFYNGNLRSTTFDVLYTTDGKNWINALTNIQSSGKTVDFEWFKFNSSIQVWKLRIVGHGNSINTWNSITEVNFSNSITGNNTLSTSNLFEVYPNPAQNFLKIKLSERIKNKGEILQILNSAGEVVFEQKINEDHEFFIDTQNFSSGIYFIKTKTEFIKVILN